MEAMKITRLDAERAIREGVETSRLRRQLEEKDKQLEELAMELTKTKAQLRMCRGIIKRNNRTAALKYHGRIESLEFDRREARADRIDCLIAGAMIGVMLVFAVFWFVIAH